MSEFISGGSPVSKVTDLGKRLRDIRQSRGEILFDMAEKLRVKTSELSSLELGKIDLTEIMMMKLVAHYPEIQSDD